LPTTTLQIQYTSDLFDNRNETYYACADIHYVSLTQFTAQIPCFNVTTDNFTAPPPEDDDSDSSSNNSNSSSTSSSEEDGAGFMAKPSLFGTLLVATLVAVAFVAGLT